MTNAILHRAALLLVPKDDACECDMCSVGRDLRRLIATVPDATTLRRWYPTLPSAAVAALVTTPIRRSEARL